MIIGTSYFITRTAANEYYAEYGEEPIRVSHKLLAGEIHIGKPPLKANERLVMLDGGKRYGIADDGPLTPRQRWGV